MDEVGPQLSLKIYPGSVQRHMCEPVESFDSELRGLVHEMLALMRENDA
jgi:hypothetical protein